MIVVAFGWTHANVAADQAADLEIAAQMRSSRFQMRLVTAKSMKKKRARAMNPFGSYAAAGRTLVIGIASAPNNLLLFPSFHGRCATNRERICLYSTHPLQAALLSCLKPQEFAMSTILARILAVLDAFSPHSSHETRAVCRIFIQTFTSSNRQLSCLHIDNRQQ